MNYKNEIDPLEILNRLASFTEEDLAKTDLEAVVCVLKEAGYGFKEGILRSIEGGKEIKPFIRGLFPKGVDK